MIKRAVNDNNTESQCIISDIRFWKDVISAWEFLQLKKTLKLSFMLLYNVFMSEFYELVKIIEEQVLNGSISELEWFDKASGSVCFFIGAAGIQVFELCKLPFRI